MSTQENPNGIEVDMTMSMSNDNKPTPQAAPETLPAETTVCLACPECGENPETVLSLISEVRELRAAIERARAQAQEVIDAHSGSPHGIDIDTQAFLTLQALDGDNQ